MFTFIILSYIIDFIITTDGWLFPAINDRKFRLTWKTCSWYNIRNNIHLHPNNVNHTAFTGVDAILPIYPNTVDRSLWRLQDYKNKIAHLKESYRFQNKLDIAKLFKQVHYYLNISLIFISNLCFN